MIGTLEALLVVLIFVLPGATYEWAFERQVGQWNARVTDRLLRFVGASALFHIFAFPVSFWVWARYVRGDRLVDAETIPWGLWPFLLVLLFVPRIAGSQVGRATRSDKRWARWITGAGAPPRAWDEIFRGDPRLLIRARLKSGAWVGGVFGRSPDGTRSYAAGYPEDEDLYVSTRVEIDEGGEWVLDDEGNVRQIEGTGLFVRMKDADILEVVRIDGGDDGQEG